MKLAYHSLNDERDPQYVRQGTHTPIPADRSTRATPLRVAPRVVTASQSKRERILTGTTSGSTAQSEGASGMENFSGS